MSEPLDALEQAGRASESPDAGKAYVDALVAHLVASPADARTRLRLGKALFDQGETHGAIPELQKAKADPATRPEAGYYLGYCFVKTKFARLAISELQRSSPPRRRRSKVSPRTRRICSGASTSRPARRTWRSMPTA